MVKLANPKKSNFSNPAFSQSFILNWVAIISESSFLNKGTFPYKFSEEIIIPAAWVEALRRAPSIDSALFNISESAKSPSWSLWFAFSSEMDNGCTGL